MHPRRFELAARALVGLVGVAVLGCGSGSDATDAPVGIAVCDEYLAKAKQCAMNNKDEKQRAEALKELSERRESWIGEMKEGGGPDISSLCESLLRKAKEDSPEKRACPDVWK